MCRFLCVRVFLVSLLFVHHTALQGLCLSFLGMCLSIWGDFLRSHQTKQGPNKKRKIHPSSSDIPTPSSLFPAMRSGTGASVVNGRWAVDPPGEYQAGGTTFTYTRPRAQAEGEEAKGESLWAPGPTKTQLQLYVSSERTHGPALQNYDLLRETCIRTEYFSNISSCHCFVPEAVFFCSVSRSSKERELF